MNKTLKEIAKLVDGDLVGREDIIIKGVSGIKEAKEGDITFLSNDRYKPLLDTTKASCVIVSSGVEKSGTAIIRAKDPSLAFAIIVDLFFPCAIKHPSGIDPTAKVGKLVKLGKNVAMGANVVVADGVEIGDNTIIYPGCYIGCETKIGKDCLIFPNVCVRERVIVGNNVVIQSGSVIGSDGFGFIVEVGNKRRRIPQTGTVVIEDGVEIGANVTIDRARFDKTVIGEGTKIDNLVQIAHNVVIGKNSVIVAQVGIAGSAHVGNNVILAGQAGIVGHIEIGDNAVVHAQGGVTKDVPANTQVSGYPARPHEEARRVNACVQRLPKLYKQIHDLEAKLEKLESDYRERKSG
jgi:UDP-3-O-[3-hydroxymyristoyl] glucosamine N-acyltransferase